MIDVLIIADDLTGALDASAPFIGAGVEIRTDYEEDLSLQAAAPDVRVLSVNANTRHLDAVTARGRVEKIVARAAQLEIPWVVKKTDSVLRGNVGAELEGALAASGARVAHFLPAFPKIGRVTCGGVHYVDGVPLAESPFAQDPFEPVTASNVLDIIAKTASVPVISIPIGGQLDAAFAGVAVYDAETEADLAVRISALAAAEGPHLIAGCAGVMAALAVELAVPAAPTVPAPNPGPTLAFCGSVNRVSVSQCAYAREAGAPYAMLPAANILDTAWCESAALDELAHGVAQALAAAPLVVVDSSTRATPADFAAAGVDPAADARSLIAGNLGRIVQRLLTVTGVENVLVMGGDVLLAFLECAGIERVSLVAQIAPGVVVSELILGGRRVRIASKSGGFGERDTFIRIAEMLSGNTVQEKEIA